VILWADRATRFDGAIDVTGPASGGFAETSAIDLLEVGDAAVVDVGPGGQWLIDPVNITINAALAASIVGTLDGGGNVTVTTELPGAEPGNLTVNSSIVWSGAGNLTLFANSNLNINNTIAITTSGAGSLDARALVDTSIAGPVTSTGSGSIRFDTGRTMIVDGNIVASGTGAVTLLAGTGDIIASNAGNDRDVVISTTSGRLRIGATGGAVRIGRIPAANTRNVQVLSTSGDIDITAGTTIDVRGNQGSSWARVQSESGAISLVAPHIRVLGGTGGNAFAEVVAGAGGAVTMQASRRIEVQNGAAGSPGRVQALDGATLTMHAPQQIWNGVVQSGTAASGTGGEVRVAGAIAAGVSPIFNLGPGNDFVLEPAADGPGAGTTASRYTSPTALRIDTRDTGRITLNGPVTAGAVTLISEERVTLAPGALVTGTGGGEAVTIAAGRGFDNRAGAAALAAPNGRWLLFLDTFAAMLGTEPATPEFDLYGRPFDYTDPRRADVGGQLELLGVPGGSRIIYGEQPVLIVTADTLAKLYGTAVSPGASTDASRLRPKDAPLINILTGGTTATSAGAAAGADAGVYATTPQASLTARGTLQRYRLDLVPGTLTVNPTPLTVAADDAARLYGSPNPTFSASFAGFVLGEGPGVLGGTLALSTVATQTSPVGAYAIVPSGLTSGNYAITFVPGTLTVNPAPLTVAADDAARLYGSPNPTFSASFAGFVLGEGPGVLGGTLALSTVATQTSPVGAYAIVPSGLTSGNYAITFVPGTLTVNPAPLTVTATGERTYGAPNPAFSASYDGFVLGQGPGVLGGAPVFATPATQASPVGVYPVTVSGLTSTNYAIVFVPGMLTVLPAPLTVTANDATRPEGQPNPPFTATITGFVLGEDGAVLGGLLALTTAATQASPPGTYAIIPSGLTSANYAISFVNGVLTVTPLGVPPGPAPQAGLVQGPEPFRRGVQPFTPADAGFRTTVLEAGPAVADPFRLAYSLGEVVQLAVGQPTFPGGFVPAAGRPEGAAPDDPGICGGPINLGPRAAGCQEVELIETYWTTIGREAR
jgi:hypothetical protein